MFKRILVATDGSEHARLAFQKAAELAKQTGAEIVLLHVAYTPEALGYVLTDGATVVQEQFTVNGEAVLDITTRGIDTTGIAVEKKVRPGHPAAVIIAETEITGSDLVVMGSRGYGAIAGSLLGSVSQKVLQHANCPVMVVK